MKDKESLFRPAVVLLGLFTILTGIIYPLVVWSVGQIIFPNRANGSLVEMNGRVVGSELIGQKFAGPEWFWSRPSAVNYDASASGGSNLATSNPLLLEAVATRIESLRTAAPQTSDAKIPVDLVTASGSGLDPHLTPAAANYQASRVAQARGVDEASMKAMIQEATDERTFGLLGEPRVNVLRLNLALNALPARQQGVRK